MKETYMLDQFTSSTPRRGFIGRMAAAAMGFGVANLVPRGAEAETRISPAVDPQLEAWFAKLKAKHSVVFDASEPNEGFPAIWPRVYLNTMEASYPGEKAAAMVILRHGGLPLALQDSLWAKYKLGEMFKVNAGNVAATSNPYATITGLPIPGLGIVELQKSGVLMGACDVALTVYSAGAAEKMGMDPAAVKKEWVAGLIPGVQVVPSGVMAVARAQELGAAYIFAG
jgi:intracellular sulfur oxidation DsrE/DsrF family protein